MISLDDFIFITSNIGIQIWENRRSIQRSKIWILCFLQNLLKAMAQPDWNESGSSLYLDIASIPFRRFNFTGRNIQQIITSTIIRDPPNTVIVSFVKFKTAMLNQKYLNKAELISLYDSRQT